MPADDTKATPVPAKPEEPKGPKLGDVLGEIDGVPFKMGDKPVKPKKPEELSLEEHHAMLTKRHDVELVVPRRVVRGRVFEEQRSKPGEVKLPSLKCVVAHRVLHGMSPDELGELRDVFKAAKVDSDNADAFEMWALRHIESKLDKVPDVLALQMHIAAHAAPAQVNAHRKAALEALAAA